MNNFTNINNLTLDGFSGDEYFLDRLFIKLYKGFPNERRIRNEYKAKDAADYIIKTYGLKNKLGQIRSLKQVRQKDINNSINSGNKTNKEELTYYIIIKEKFIILIEDNLFNVVFDDSIELEEVLKLEKEILKFTKKKKRNHFYMIAKDYDSFSLNEFKIKNYKIDIKLHYNDDIEEFNKSALSFLKNNNKTGLLLMHGLPGTGKTTYIRHLIKKVNREFIFLPLFMAKELSSPDLLPFLTEHKNSILIIEDSEKLITNRESGNNDSGISTLLNLSDGLVSDAFGIKIICTFNTGIANIDKALLRKGRLINRYEFKELSAEKAKKIAEIYNIDYDGKEPIKIGDLFNTENNNQSDMNDRKTIGFNR